MFAAQISWSVTIDALQDTHIPNAEILYPNQSGAQIRAAFHHYSGVFSPH